jgi:tRNA(Ile)-lysidine synthetase-like protein
MKRPLPYPVPGPQGGRLIRSLIQGLRASGRKLPLDTSHIHIAVSGGSDSLALARLLIRYGRKICSPKQLRILHIDHEWRPESAADAQTLRKLAREWGIPIQIIRARGRAKPKPGTGESWEATARAFRQAAFRKLTEKGHLVLTAHTADDLAETVLWRLLTGTAKTHGGGILTDDHGILRPLLRTRKPELQAFLEEEGINPLEDRTNSDPRFLRSRLRQEVFPTLEKIFPNAVEHLGELALSAQGPARKSAEAPFAQALRTLGISARASHWQSLNRVLAGSSTRKAGQTKTIQFPEGWRLVGRGESWTFERADKAAKPPKSLEKTR